MIADSESRIVVFSGDLVDAARDLRFRYPSVERWICVDPADGFDSYAELIRARGRTARRAD